MMFPEFRTKIIFLLESYFPGTRSDIFSCIQLIYNHLTTIMPNLVLQLGLITKLYASKLSNGLQNGCLCLQIRFYLANSHGSGDKLKANIDGSPESLLFLTRRSILIHFALINRYHFDISFQRTLLAVFTIHTEPSYQRQKGQSV